MTDENLLKLSPNHPFLAVCIASFSMRTGVIIRNLWKYDERFENRQWLTDLLKFNLLNVQQQQQSSFADCPASFFQLLEHKISYFASIFIHQADSYPEYWCFAIFINETKVNLKTLYVNTVTQQTCYCGKIVRKFCEENNINGAMPEVERILNIISQLLSPHTFSIQPMKLDYFDINFLGTLIASHLQTQMTTIIESNNQEEAKLLFDILMNFCLDYQKSLSDKYYRNTILPFLYVQITWQQAAIPMNMLWEFKRPFTWVQLSQRIVIQSPAIEVQRTAFIENQNIKTSSLSEEEIKARAAKISRIYKLNVIRSSEYGVSIISKLLSVNQKFLDFYTKQVFAKIVQKAILLTELCETIIKSDDIPTHEEIHHIDSILDLSDESPYKKDERGIIISIAALFNHNSYKKLYLDRKDKAMYLMSNL
ncbi:hypothetical protein TVAG_180080 [Trichomonas vaginalis G3]|uniref:Uncharacterized protein n=1 Tax=Trichomonas vaginalis (strain ATCC PRA-98 / G3) TaxID=412133 RepID=A2EE37_TRIV3|nr:guanine nucleotide exchange c9orf72 family [Trichomonas vaginalis G3]EAY09034.1 hypothetical protein TVAG_180080 [Trichomonas vaginalis G3]KAI5503452.1 guanine nucleotide exchange c9orf72 family [Trichomonas vaginalis G3]|eukprot:XP_001321257.1 hypothetical protein [Trichomonas vaginalis G3]